MRTTKPITVSLPSDLLRETQRVAKEESRTRSELIRHALEQYLATRRWQRLREWGTGAAERLGLKTEADLQRVLDKARSGQRKAPGVIRVVADTNIYVSALSSEEPLRPSWH